MKQLIVLSLIALVTLPAQAQWWGGKGIKGNGEVTTITRSVGDYDQIHVAGFFDVDLVYGNEGTITIEGESNLLEYLVTEVNGNALKIKTEKGKNLKPSRNKTIRVTVPFKDIDEVTLSGSGDVVGKDVIKTDTFKTAVAGSGDVIVQVEANTVDGSVAGSGDLTVKGDANSVGFSVAGSGDIHAGNLKAQEAYARVAGSGDIRVNCSKYLKARVSGSGDIEYSGNPDKEDTKVAGSGSISSGY